MNVLVVDDHPIMRKGIVYLLQTLAGHDSTSEADSIASALQQVARQPPDVIVLDLSLGRESGLDLIRRLRDQGSTVPILVLSVFDEAMHAERVLRAGSQGYLMKESAPDQLLDAVRRVARGEIVISAPMQARIMAAWVDGGSNSLNRGGMAGLSPRELEVLRLIGQGLSTAQIAEQQVRSLKTIEAHRSNIQRKLGLASAAQLVRYATLWLERGAVPLGETPREPSATP